MQKFWLVYEHGNPVEFHGLFRRKRDANDAFRTQRENLRTSGDDGYDRLAIEEFEFESHRTWSK